MIRLRNKTSVLALVGAALVVFALAGRRRAVISGLQRLRGRASVEQRVAEYGPSAELRLRDRFGTAHIQYPPRSVILLGLKAERELRLLASDGGALKPVATFPILAASGTLGPKRREGDRQVPEGEYRAECLNPNSLYHLAIRVSYPNDDDRRAAEADGRTQLGGDIMIHGKSASIGCLAVGDAAIEELFILAARVGTENVEVVIAPSVAPMSDLKPDSPPWLRARYESLQSRVDDLTR